MQPLSIEQDTFASYNDGYPCLLIQELRSILIYPSISDNDFIFKALKLNKEVGYCSSHIQNKFTDVPSLHFPHDLLHASVNHAKSASSQKFKYDEQSCS